MLHRCTLRLETKPRSDHDALATTLMGITKIFTNIHDFIILFHDYFYFMVLNDTKQENILTRYDPTKHLVKYSARERDKDMPKYSVTFLGRSLSLSVPKLREIRIRYTLLGVACISLNKTTRKAGNGLTLFRYNRI